MSATKSSRQFGAFAQILTLVGTQLKRLLLARKTKALVAIQLVPVLGAIVYVMFESVDGLTMFSEIAENLTIPFLVPLAALFYGGPAIVDEMEGRTLTFLTLRPIGKPILFLGKVIAAILMALPTVLLPLAILFLVCLFQSEDMGASTEHFLQIVGASAAGIVTYTAIFAALGAIFASSILASIVYFVTIEIVFSSLPMLELLAVKYHVKNLSGMQATDRLGILDKIVMDEPLRIEWWISLLVCTVLTVGITSIGTMVFRNRQYYV